MRKWWALPTVLVAFALAAPSANAADELQITRAEEADGQVTIEFSVPAAVAPDLDPASDVEVLENGVAVEHTVAPVPSNGLEIVLVIDTSGSMRENGAIDAAKAAANAFLDRLPADVTVGVVSFDDTPSLVAPLGTDRNATRAALASLTASGETALFDAMVFSSSLFSGGTNDKQIILLSDGGDTVSFNTFENALAVASTIRTSVIELTSSEANAQVLFNFAVGGGGTMAQATDPDTLGTLYGDVANDLLNRYRVQLTAAATGDVVYTVRVDSSEGVLEASTTITVDTAATSTTVDFAVTTLPNDPGDLTGAPVSTAGASPEAEAAGEPSGLSANVLRLLGGLALFTGALLLFLLITAPRAQRSQRLTARKTVNPLQEQPEGVVDRLTGATERAMGDTRYTALGDKLDIAAIPLRPSEFLLLCISIGTVFTIILAVVLPTLIGLIAGLVLSPLIARGYLNRKMEARRKAFVEQIPDLLQILVTSLRAGYGLPQALDLAATQIDDPARSELQRVLFEVRIGRDPGDALQAAADRMGSSDFNWVVAAMQINREVGGELAVVLENVAETVRERQRLRRQIRVLTAEGRASAYVLTALPFVVGGALWFANRDYFDPFKDPPGPALVVMGIVLILVGWFWMRRLIKEPT